MSHPSNPDIVSASHDLSVTGKRWIMRETCERTSMGLAQTHALDPLIAQLILNRGITDQTIDSYLVPSLKASLPDPFHLKDMDVCIHRLMTAITSGSEKIAIFGDYDVDGATSSALLKRYFRALGIDLTIYIPDREREGYGPNTKALSQLKQDGHSLVISVDCGTTAFEALAHAKSIGLDMIVIDHHIAEPNLPECVGIINPNRLDQVSSSAKDCAAVGVVFLTLVALQKTLRDSGFFSSRAEPDLLSFLDLVATGTVCDVVALKGLNRAYVKQGLKVMAKRQNPGLTALADISGLTSFPSAYHLGFLIGPRINAGGRVGQSHIGADLLSSDDPKACAQKATQLDIFNTERKEIEAQVLAEAQKQAEVHQDNPMIIVAGTGWHPGVIGIVAGRLKEQYHKPAFVISIDEQGIGKGSGRSVSGFDIGSMIQAARQKGILENGGGHAMAGGLTIHQDQLETFRHFCFERLSKEIDKGTLDLTPALKLDATLTIGAATIEFLESMEQLAPYGQGNPTPKLRFDNVNILKADVVGENHVRCVLSDFEKTGSLKAIAFRALGTPLGDALLAKRTDFISLAGSLKLDEWNGRKTVQFMIDDAKTSCA